MSVNISTLSNGLRVVTDTMTDIDSVTLGVWVKVGARYEKQEVNGISHLLEHMAFKGTETRSARKIAEEIEDVGGFMNAYTSREVTAYHVKVLKEHFALGAEIIADILLNSNFPEEELQKEKGVIIQEIKRSQDDPYDVVFDDYQDTIYKDQPLGRSILGPIENIKKMTRDDIFEYMNNGYTAPRMVFSVSGNIEHSDVMTVAEKLFSNISSEDKVTFEKATYTPGEARHSKENEQVNLVLGFKGYDYHHKDYFTATILSAVLGGGMSSRLFQEIREKRGLVYSIYAFSSSNSDTGNFGIYAGTGIEEVKELIPVACEELKKVTKEISDDEISRAKARIKSSILMGREESDRRCDKNASQLLMFDRIIPKEEMINNYEKVTKQDLIRVAGEIFSTKPSIASIGPIENVCKYDELLELLKN